MVKGCEREQRCKGLCTMHYTRLWRFGSLTGSPRRVNRKDPGDVKIMNLRMPGDVMQQVEAIAQAEGESQAATVRRLVRDGLRRKKA